MSRLVQLRFTSLASTFIVLAAAALAGCGDDTPAQPADGGGNGGAGGATADGGVDSDGAGGADADASNDAGDGATDSMGEVPKPCYMVAFTAPIDGAMLTAADDKDADNCADGFQLDVSITTNAPDGADVSLFGGNALLKAGTVLNGAVTFSSVQIATSGNTQLSIQFPGRETCTDATTKAQVSVDCHVPACSVTKPVVNAAHPKLNGELAPAGDRVRANGTYQVAFEVTTDVEDGQTVSLLVDNAASPTAVTTLTAMSVGGKAEFAGVDLAPDGSYEIEAKCPARNGVVGVSTKGTYIVDTTPPSLTVSKPSDGEFIGPGELIAGDFQVCGSTTSSDAAGLGPGLGAAAQNLCAFIGGSPLCTALTATGSTGCINVPCNGGAPFDITVVLNDDAGNKTSTTINAVSCASSLPSVQIIKPVSDAPTFTNPTKHLLAATGGQTDVVACTNRAGTAVLSIGHMGDASLTPVGGSPVSTVAAGAGCPAGFGFQVTFPAVTLPQSLENADGTLLAPTELRVDVTDVSTAVGSSLPLDVWVDSVAPALSLLSPTGLCGSFHQVMGVAGFSTPVQLSTDSASVVLTVTNGGSTDTLSPTTFSGGVATFSTVAFDQGASNMAAVASDPAGNSTQLAPAPCTVTVGMAPVVAFTSPTVGKELCAAGSTGANCINDTTPGTSGWQGNLVAHVTGGGAPLTSGNVTFAVGSTTLVPSVPLDSMGNATFTNATILDGTVTITATTDNIPGRGVGSGTVTVLVDTGPPDPPTNLVATVLDRRQTSFQLSWTAPGDNGSTVSGYKVRYAKVAITATNFDDTTVTTDVPYTGSPAAPGAADGIAVSGLYIESGYYFAVRAVDAAGNLSTIVGTSAAVTAHFTTTILTSPSGTNQLFGQTIDGEGDANGDGISDLVIGTSNDTHAYLYLGASGFAPTGPTTTFTGANTLFGRMIRFVGDIDGDGLQDLAIGDPNGNRVFIYKGRTTWPAALADTAADYVITTDATWAGSGFGVSIAPLGDFDGDGVDDFVIGAQVFNGRIGRVAVIYGRAGFTSFGLPNTARSLEIGGDSTLIQTAFGAKLVGLGHFYSVTTGTTLIVSAPGIGGTTSTSANEGRIYAFHGRGPGAAIDVTAADAVTVGPAKSAKIGTVLLNLGPIMNTLPSLGSGNVGDLTTIPGVSGSVFVYSGAAATGPFTSKVAAYQSGTTGNGQVVFGGGFSGRDIVSSLIGSSKPDLALMSVNATTLDIIDGDRLPSLTGPIDAKTVADVHVPMPPGWIGTASGIGNLIRDIDGDGHADFALGDQFGNVPGRVVVFR